MIKVVYINHSGTAVIFDDLVLLFDLEKVKLPEEANGRPVIFFASHEHQDHFNPVIFEMGKKRADVSYVLSSDILKQYRKKEAELEGLTIESVKPDLEYILDAGNAKLEIKTLHSTDRGVAFLVKYKNCGVYHAGDLNCWAWPGDEKQNRNREIADYQREINKLKAEKVDIAFVPLDPRLEEDYRRGMDYFLEHVPCRSVMPIHMWGQYDLIREYKNTLPDEQREKILETKREMQEFILDH